MTVKKHVPVKQINFRFRIGTNNINGITLVKRGIKGPCQ